MSFYWTIYGTDLYEKLENRLLQFLLGDKKVIRIKIWKEQIKDFFSDCEI